MTELADRIRQIRWEITEDVAKQQRLNEQQTENAHWLVEEIYDRCQCHADWEYISCVVCDWLTENDEITETDIDNLAYAIEI